MAAQPFFSIKAAIKISALHLGLTYVFAFLAFITAMGSFTKSVTDEMAFWNMVMWGWTPLARAVFQSGSENLEDIQLQAVAWSCMVGVTAGFLRKHFRFANDLAWGEE